MAIEREDLEDADWQFMTPLDGERKDGVYCCHSGRLLLTSAKNEDARDIGHLAAAAPALALACLNAREYIAYLESLLIDLGHPYDGAEPATPNLLTALEAAGVEMPNGQDV